MMNNKMKELDKVMFISGSNLCIGKIVGHNNDKTKWSIFTRTRVYHNIPTEDIEIIESSDKYI